MRCLAAIGVAVVVVYLAAAVVELVEIDRLNKSINARLEKYAQRKTAKAAPPQGAVDDLISRGLDLAIEMGF